MAKATNLFSVVRRVVPAHGIKVGCTTDTIAARLNSEEARELADKLQSANPDEEYATVEMVFRYYTKPQED